MKAYVVTCGVYSDYSIVGIYSTPELAQNAADRKSKGDIHGGYRIEEWEMDAPICERYKPEYCCYVRLDTGEIFEELEGGDVVSDEIFSEVRGIARVANYDFNLCSNRPGENKALIVYSESSVSPEHAREMAAEKRQEWLRLRAIDMEKSIKPI